MILFFALILCQIHSLSNKKHFVLINKLPYQYITFTESFALGTYTKHLRTFKHQNLTQKHVLVISRDISTFYLQKNNLITLSLETRGRLEEKNGRPLRIEEIICHQNSRNYIVNFNTTNHRH